MPGLARDTAHLTSSQTTYSNSHLLTCQVSHVTLLNSPAWTLHLWNSTDVHVHDIHVHNAASSDNANHSFGPNTDGIDVDSSNRVLIEVISIHTATFPRFRHYRQSSPPSLPTIEVCQLRRRPCLPLPRPPPAPTPTPSTQPPQPPPQDSVIHAGDDCVVIKSGLNAAGRAFATPSANIHVRNVTLDACSCFKDGSQTPGKVFYYDGCGGLKIGTEVSGGIANVTFESSTVRCVASAPSFTTERRIKRPSSERAQTDMQTDTDTHAHTCTCSHADMRELRSSLRLRPVEVHSLPT